MPKFNLGDVAKDKITGFRGVVIAITKWIHGCNRLVVQPEGVEKSTGKPKEAATFDEPQLELVAIGKHSTTSNTGGPTRDVPRRKDPSRR